jgi:hypothetical protein
VCVTQTGQRSGQERLPGRAGRRLTLEMIELVDQPGQAGMVTRVLAAVTFDLRDGKRDLTGQQRWASAQQSQPAVGVPGRLVEITNRLPVPGQPQPPTRTAIG